MVVCRGGLGDKMEWGREVMKATVVWVGEVEG